MRQRQEDPGFKASTSKVSKTLSRKQNTNKRAGGVAQVLPSIKKKKNADAITLVRYPHTPGP
jgi:hypothetical protein